MAEVPMKLARITLLVAFCLLLAACGGSSSGSGSPGTINGNWAATLSGTGVSPSVPVTIQFTVTLNQTSPPAVDATNFTRPNSCFSDPSTLSATFSGGAFTLQILAFSGAFQNKLNLQGNLDGNTITGNWTFVGGASQESCSASGTFKMTRS
jgi:hypothetical protein